MEQGPALPSLCLLPPTEPPFVPPRVRTDGAASPGGREALAPHGLRGMLEWTRGCCLEEHSPFSGCLSCGSAGGYTDTAVPPSSPPTAEPLSPSPQSNGVVRDGQTTLKCHILAPDCCSRGEGAASRPTVGPVGWEPSPSNLKETCLSHGGPGQGAAISRNTLNTHPFRLSQRKPEGS
eukprot:734936-Rhodomonas_salina.2